MSYEKRKGTLTTPNEVAVEKIKIMNTKRVYSKEKEQKQHRMSYE